MRQPGGIRSKITFWFYLLLTFMVGNSLITYGIVRKVEEKLLNVETVDAFLENTLEVRSMEKNFLLYDDPQSLEEGVSHLATLTRQLAEHEELFISLSSLYDVSKVRTALQDYNTTFSQLSSPALRNKAASEIREQGTRLTLLAEDLVERERRAINELLRMISHSLLFMLPFLILFVGAVAAILGNGIVFSLKQLEKYAATIATGNFVEVNFSSNSREVGSLINAFNRMSRELKSRQQQLVRSEKLASLGTMLAGVAHEFNNPLSVISSSAEILAEEIGGEKDSLPQELLGQIIAETRRASSITKTLLNLARNENFHRDHYPLKSLLQEITVLLRRQLSSDVEVQLAIPDEVNIFADKQKIQQVFINLLKNSKEAMGGKGKICVKAWQDQSVLKIVVSDDGPGMSAQVKEKIFDPFFTTNDKGQGSGLGLFIVHDIIVQHGGTISVDSVKGEGATFTIILPVKENL